MGRGQNHPQTTEERNELLPQSLWSILRSSKGYQEMFSALLVAGVSALGFGLIGTLKPHTDPEPQNPSPIYGLHACCALGGLVSKLGDSGEHG